MRDIELPSRMYFTKESLTYTSLFSSNGLCSANSFGAFSPCWISDILARLDVRVEPNVTFCLFQVTPAPLENWARIVGRVDLNVFCDRQWVTPHVFAIASFVRLKKSGNNGSRKPSHGKSIVRHKNSRKSSPAWFSKWIPAYSKYLITFRSISRG